jgi:hypothetical protein
VYAQAFTIAALVGAAAVEGLRRDKPMDALEEKLAYVPHATRDK